MIKTLKTYKLLWYKYIKINLQTKEGGKMKKGTKNKRNYTNSIDNYDYSIINFSYN